MKNVLKERFFEKEFYKRVLGYDVVVNSNIIWFREKLKKKRNLYFFDWIFFFKEF